MYQSVCFCIVPVKEKINEIQKHFAPPFWLRSVDTCENMIPADKYHVTMSGGLELIKVTSFRVDR